jgi:hypothetical protein
MHEVAIVIIIPGGHSINNFITLVAHCTKQCIDQWPSAGSNENFVGIVIESLVLFGKCTNSFSQFKTSFTGRIVGEMIAIGFYNGVLEFFRDRKNFWIEISNRKIINLFSLADSLTDFSAQLHYFRTDEGMRQMRKFHVFFLSGKTKGMEGVSCKVAKFSRSKGSLRSPVFFTAENGGRGGFRREEIFVSRKPVLLEVKKFSSFV